MHTRAYARGNVVMEWMKREKRIDSKNIVSNGGISATPYSNRRDVHFFFIGNTSVLLMILLRVSFNTFRLLSSVNGYQITDDHIEFHIATGGAENNSAPLYSIECKITVRLRVYEECARTFACTRLRILLTFVVVASFSVYSLRVLRVHY